jgi:hypothetical protein
VAAWATGMTPSVTATEIRLMILRIKDCPKHLYSGNVAADDAGTPDAEEATCLTGELSGTDWVG